MFHNYLTQHRTTDYPAACLRQLASNIPEQILNLYTEIVQGAQFEAFPKLKQQIQKKRLQSLFVQEFCGSCKSTQLQVRQYQRSAKVSLDERWLEKL